MSRLRIRIDGIFDSTVQRLVSFEFIRGANWFGGRDFAGTLPRASGSPTIGVVSDGLERANPISGDADIKRVRLGDASEELARVRKLGLSPDEVSDIVNGLASVAFDERLDEAKDALFDGRKQKIIAGKGQQTVEGGDRKDIIKTGAGADLVIATAGDDRIVMGGGKRDTLSFEALAESALEAALVFRKDVAEILGFTQSILGVERVVGTPNDDLFIGGGRANTFFGLPGDDVIRGKGGPDRLYGEPGVDEIRAGRGNDRIWGGPDGDFICTREGKDRVRAGDGDDFVRVSNDETTRVRGGTGEDEVRAFGEDVIIWGGPDDDEFHIRHSARVQDRRFPSKVEIKDFEAGDVLAIALEDFGRADTTRARQSGSDTVIKGRDGLSVTLRNVSAQDLQKDIEVDGLGQEIENTYVLI